MQITFTSWSSHKTTKLCCSSSQNCALLFFNFFFPLSPSLPRPHVGIASSFGLHIRFSLTRQQLRRERASERAQAGFLCSGNKIPFYSPWDFFPPHIRINWCISWSRHAVSLPKVCIVHNSLIPVTFSPGSCSALSQNTVQCRGTPPPHTHAQPTSPKGQRGWHLNQACQKYRTEPTSIHSASRQRSHIVWQLHHGAEPSTTALIQPSRSLFQFTAHRF